MVKVVKPPPGSKPSGTPARTRTSPPSSSKSNTADRPKPRPCSANNLKVSKTTTLKLFPCLHTKADGEACTESFTSEQQLTRHRALCVFKRMYKCSKCTGLFRDAWRVTRHNENTDCVKNAARVKKGQQIRGRKARTTLQEPHFWPERIKKHPEYKLSTVRSLTGPVRKYRYDHRNRPNIKKMIEANPSLLSKNTNTNILKDVVYDAARFNTFTYKAAVQKRGGVASRSSAAATKSSSTRSAIVPKHRGNPTVAGLKDHGSQWHSVESRRAQRAASEARKKRAKQRTVVSPPDRSATTRSVGTTAQKLGSTRTDIQRNVDRLPDRSATTRSTTAQKDVLLTEAAARETTSVQKKQRTVDLLPDRSATTRSTTAQKQRVVVSRTSAAATECSSTRSAISTCSATVHRKRRAVSPVVDAGRWQSYDESGSVTYHHGREQDLCGAALAADDVASQQRASESGVEPDERTASERLSIIRSVIEAGATSGAQVALLSAVLGAEATLKLKGAARAHQLALERRAATGKKLSPAKKRKKQNSGAVLAGACEPSTSALSTDEQVLSDISIEPILVSVPALQSSPAPVNNAPLKPKLKKPKTLSAVLGRMASGTVKRAKRAKAELRKVAKKMNRARSSAGPPARSLTPTKSGVDTPARALVVPNSFVAGPPALSEVTTPTRIVLSADMEISLLNSCSRTINQCDTSNQYLDDNWDIGKQQDDGSIVTGVEAAKPKKAPGDDDESEVPIIVTATTRDPTLGDDDDSKVPVIVTATTREPTPCLSADEECFTHSSITTEDGSLLLNDAVVTSQLPVCLPLVMPVINMQEILADNNRLWIDIMKPCGVYLATFKDLWLGAASEATTQVLRKSGRIKNPNPGWNGGFNEQSYVVWALSCLDSGKSEPFLGRVIGNTWTDAEGTEQSSGYTVKTTQDFYPSQPVCVYGEGVSETEILAVEKKHDSAGTSEACNKILEVDAMSGGHKKRFFVDGSQNSTLMGPFVNHKNKNTNVRPLVVWNGDVPIVILVAKCYLPIGTELGYAYHIADRNYAVTFPWYKM